MGSFKNIFKVNCCILFLILFSCQSEQSETNLKNSFSIQGNTQGTTYQIIISDTFSNITKKEVDQLLANFDTILSGYIPESLVSKINASQNEIKIFDKFSFFKEVYEESYFIYQLSNGAFDPSIYPLAEGWGFLKNINSPLSKKEVDSILNFISFEKNLHHKVIFSPEEKGSWLTFVKINPLFKLDFNAIAQGLAVDKVVELLEQKGHANFYVEIGGELRVRGFNPENKAWRIGVDLPVENQNNKRLLENVIEINKGALATSGNYRKFYEVDGVKYAHTLNPKTGFPVNHSLLSVTVLAEKCSTADALATTFMVLGLEDSKAFLKKNKNLEIEAYFLYSDNEGNIKRHFTSGIGKMLSN
jgi:FAD:protein FMN transferase